MSTLAGDIELRIPKLRVGSFLPSLLEPRRRVDQALWAVIMTAYIVRPAGIETFWNASERLAGLVELRVEGDCLA